VETKTNRQIFDRLSDEFFLKSHQKAVRVFREIALFPNAIGFDDNSQGFLVLHRRHAPSGFEQEIPVCLFLKNLGCCVILVEETPHQKTADAEIDGVVFEIKQVARAKNIQRAILRQFRTAYHKCDNILLHIAQQTTINSIRSALKTGIKTYPSIKLVWIVFENRLYRFSRKNLQSGNIEFDEKK